VTAGRLSVIRHELMSPVVTLKLSLIPLTSITTQRSLKQKAPEALNGIPNAANGMPGNNSDYYLTTHSGLHKFPRCASTISRKFYHGKFITMVHLLGGPE
jgi:hypothetical protein